MVPKGCGALPNHLHSGIKFRLCCTSLSFLRLLSSDGTTASENSFNKGIKHIDHLKKSGQEYIKQYVKGYEVRFIGKDALVSSRLNDLILGKAFPTPLPEFAYNPIRLKKTTLTNGEQDWEQVKAS